MNDNSGSTQPADKASNAPGSANDTISIQVGEHAEHVAAGKNIIQIGSLSIPRWLAWSILGVLMLVAILIAVVMFLSRQTGEDMRQTVAILVATPTSTATATPVPTPSPSPLPFPIAKDGETLIVILPFHTTTTVDSEPHKKIGRRIQALLAEMPDTTVKVVIDPNTVLTADQQAEAEALGRRYNASMVIWGEDTGVELDASFLNLRAPQFAADVDIQETQNSLLANPSQYAKFVTRSLPSAMGFLALFGIGQSYYLTYDYTAARSAIAAAIAEATSTGDLTSTVAGLADAYFQLGWLKQIDLTDVDGAIADYTKAIEIDPKYAAAYANRAEAHIFQSNFDQALLDSTKAVELDPKLALGYISRGIVHYVQGNFDKAIVDYSQAVALDPENSQAYANRANAYRTLGQVDETIADYSRALEHAPNAAGFYAARADAYRVRGDADRAIADYTKALELDPYAVTAYLGRAHVFIDQGLAQAARKDFAKVIEYDPEDAMVYNDLCRNLALLGSPAEALTYCDMATAILDRPDFLDSRGLAHALLGEYPAAVADFQAALDGLLQARPQNVPMIEQRRTWIAALQRGEDPFTPEVLAALRTQ